MTDMRWLLISSQHHPTHGGIGTYVSRFVNAAVHAGWSVDLVTRPSDVHPLGARVHALTTPDMEPDFAQRIDALRRIERIRPYRYALWSLAVAEHLLAMDGEFDAIEFVDCQAEGYAALCSPRVRKHHPGGPMIVHAHTPMFVEEEINRCDSTRFGRSIYHGWERAALAASDGIIATSRLLGNCMPSNVPQAVIPYPIEAERFEVDASTRGEIILFAGSIQPRKGADTWAQSLNDVFRRLPNARAIMVGPDTPTAPRGSSMVAHVKSLIRPEFADRLEWRGARPHLEVLELMTDAALVVVPSLFESFSFVAAEALARGTPVLVSDQVGLAEHVDGVPSCPAGDAQAWSDAQIRMLGNLKSECQRATASRERLFETCSPQRHLQRRIEFLQSLQAALPVRVNSKVDVDAIDELATFIAEVEASERAAALASSAGS